MCPSSAASAPIARSVAFRTLCDPARELEEAQEVVEGALELHLGGDLGKVLSGASFARMEPDHFKSGHGRLGGNIFQRRRRPGAAGKQRMQLLPQCSRLLTELRQAAQFRAQARLVEAGELDLFRGMFDTPGLAAVHQGIVQRRQRQDHRHGEQDALGEREFEQNVEVIPHVRVNRPSADVARAERNSAPGRFRRG